MAGHKLWTASDAYEPYVGRWSRLVAPQFVAWLGATSGLDWVDVGCGTGELSNAIIRTAAPRSLRGVEPSEAFIATARQRLGSDRVTFTLGDAQHLPFEDQSADVLVSGLVLNFVPDVHAALAGFARVTRPGAVVAAYVWDYAAGMQMMRHFWDAAAELDDSAKALDEGRRCTVCGADELRALFAGAGLQRVEARAIDVPTVFADFDDYWTPFLAGGAPAPRYAASLSEERRSELRERLQQRLPAAADGSIALTARAWAVKAAR